MAVGTYDSGTPSRGRNALPVSEGGPTIARRNVELIGTLERRASERRSWDERVSDRTTRRIGTLWFLLVHVVIVSLWVAVNLGAVPAIRSFDPFPFGILTLIVSAEGVFLAIFVLISQNRMMRDADRRAHLDLQLSLLTEQNTTKVIQQLQHLSMKLGLTEGERDPEAAKLAEPTDLEKIADELERFLPKG